MPWINMANRKCVTISISPELHAVAARLLASGRYGNFSEVVRAALRLLDEREQDVDASRLSAQRAHPS